jgi:excisionase family DNA binding protein
MSKPDQSADAISLAEAAAQLGVHPRTIARAIARGEITAIRQGRNLEISRASLAHFGTRKRGRGRPLHIAPSAPPAPLTSFIGREQLVSEVSQLLQQKRARFFTLTGPGGVGKTRLALQVLERTVGHFSGGGAFVPLAAVTDPALVMPAIARTLGLPATGERAAAEQVQQALARAPFLLVLDNLEQVRDAGPALAAVVAACPDLAVLVTSRVRLMVAGEHCLPVPSLTLPAELSLVRDDGTGSLPPSLTQAESVRLFVERARAVVPEFALSPENGSDVAAICRRLDGVPLALELAAARVRHLQLSDLRDRLDSALPLLVGGPHDAPLRLQTMRTAIAWSYNLLTPAQQAFFRSLAVFVGGFEADAVVALQQRLNTAEPMHGDVARQQGDVPPAVLELLSVLIDHSLLQIMPAPVEHPGSATRYAFLETIREFGLEQVVAEGEEERLRSAHAAWCLDLARQSDILADGPARAAWFARLEREHVNFRAALSWYLEQQDHAAGFEVICALAWFWTSRGYLHEAMRWVRSFLGLPGSITHPLRGAVLREAGNIAHWCGDTATAVTNCDEALAQFQAMEDQPGIKYTLRVRASVAIEQGDAGTAARLLAASANIPSPSGGIAAAWDAAFEHYLQGRLGAAIGRTAEALQAFALAAAAFGAINDREYVAASRCQQAAAYCELGHIPRAREAYRDGLAIASELDQPYWMAFALAGAAYLALQANRRTQAVRLYAIARHFLEDTGLSWPDDAISRALSQQLAHAPAAVPAGTRQEIRERALHEAMSVLADDADGAGAHEGPLSDLTPREREVLVRLAQGLTDKEIAHALGMSRHTAINHVAAIRRKLGVPTRTAAAAAAAQLGAAASA